MSQEYERQLREIGLSEEDEPDDGEEPDDERLERTVSFRLTAEHGAIWLHTYEVPNLVRVDPDTGTAAVFVTLDPPDGYRWGVEPELRRGPIATRDWLWFPGPLGILRRVDPRTGAQESTMLGVGPSRWSGAGDYLWATTWPAGDVLRFRQDSAIDEAPVTRRVGTHVQGCAAGRSVLWVVDRVDESLICLDSATLDERARIALGGGRVHWLACDEDRLIFGYNRDLEEGLFLGPSGLMNQSFVREATPDGDVRQLATLTGHPDAVVHDGMLWRASGYEGWLGTDLNDPGRTLRVPVDYQGDDIAFLGTQIWTAGFRVGSQATVLHVFDRVDGSSREIDLTGIDWGRPVEDMVGKEARTESIDVVRAKLPSALRNAVAAPWIGRDARTGERSEHLNDWQRQFEVESAELVDDRVEITFRWRSEPGVRFGLTLWGDGADTTADELADDLSLELMEEFETGFMTWAVREELDGIVWLHSPEQ